MTSLAHMSLPSVTSQQQLLQPQPHGSCFVGFPQRCGLHSKKADRSKKKKQQLFKGKKINVELSTTPRVYYQVKVSRVVVV